MTLLAKQINSSNWNMYAYAITNETFKVHSLAHLTSFNKSKHGAIKTIPHNRGYTGYEFRAIYDGKDAELL